MENEIYVTTWDLHNRTYSNQTGRFPFMSYKGNKYMMVVVELDLSAILVEAIKNKSAEEIKTA